MVHVTKSTGTLEPIFLRAVQQFGLSYATCSAIWCNMGTVTESKVNHSKTTVSKHNVHLFH